MTRLATFGQQLRAMPLIRAWRGGKVAQPQQGNPAGLFRLESAAFTHALVALAAKLVVCDAVPSKAEYAAFQALFVEGEGTEAARLRSLFLKHLDDQSSAVQFARQVVSMTQGNAVLHRELLWRLVQVAQADGPMNPAEIEFLGSVAQGFALPADALRALLMAQAAENPSPYALLGVAPNAADAVVRARYLEQAQMLHPDRYHGVGMMSETVTILSDQLASLNAAYEEIRRLRVSKSPRRTTKGTSAAA